MNRLTCYPTLAGQPPMMRAAPPTRDWMDATPHGFAYRCLPLTVANTHGWELLAQHAVHAVWDGGMDKSSMIVTGPAISHFGSGILTFHPEALFRTPPGYNLWTGGSPNSFKHGIQPMTGLVETSWSPYTFTMNWKFTAPGSIDFLPGEPFCFIFPIKRGDVETFKPIVRPMVTAPKLNEQYKEWDKSRKEFHEYLARENPQKPADQWQKSYHKGELPDGSAAPEHQTRIKLEEFQ